VPVTGEREPRRLVRPAARGAHAEGLIIRPAHPCDIDAVKAIADQNRPELGFHTRQSFAEGVRNTELLVAATDGRLAGFLRFHQTRAGHATLREIATSAEFRGRGIGRALVLALVDATRGAGATSIRLNCPVELPANEFYRSLGFRRSHRRSKAGKSRPL